MEEGCVNTGQHHKPRLHTSVTLLKIMVWDQMSGFLANLTMSKWRLAGGQFRHCQEARQSKKVLWSKEFKLRPNIVSVVLRSLAVLAHWLLGSIPRWKSVMQTLTSGSIYLHAMHHHHQGLVGQLDSLCKLILEDESCDLICLHIRSTLRLLL